MVINPARLVIPILVAIALGIFLPGINWGLPSRDVDPFLFGDHAVWSGREILKLAGPTEDADRGADVASHAGPDRSTAVVVNGTDTERARIIRRYRLQSYQPDEWNTLKALSEMKPGRGNFDPKLYQYGGLWVYPVGVLLKVAATFHCVELRADVTWYLDHPEAFGRFYVIARLWSVCWGLAGVATIYAIVRRIVGGSFFPAVAAIGFMAMPVVVNMAHEAKPHLAGAVLMLLAVLSASRYAEKGGKRRWMLAGALCGAALGMVLTTLPIFFVLPAMVMLRASTWHNKILVVIGSAGVGVITYFLTNPYVPFNYVFHRAVLASNLGNSSAMYHPDLSVAGIRNTAYLIAAGTSPILAIVGLIAAIALGFRAVRVRGSRDEAEIRRRMTGLLLAVPALAVFFQFLLIAANKPGEFGRFLLLPDIFLLVEAVVWLAGLSVGWAYSPTDPASQEYGGRVRPPYVGIAKYSVGGWLGIALIGFISFSGVQYLRAFLHDAGHPTSRLIMAEQMRSFAAHENRTLAIHADPAPYCLPPMNLFDDQLILLPKDAGPNDGLAMARMSIRAVDVANDDRSWRGLFDATPISWADKPFDIRSRD